VLDVVALLQVLALAPSPFSLLFSHLSVLSVRRTKPMVLTSLMGKHTGSAVLGNNTCVSTGKP
jgi:hypothetical protein